MGPKENGKKLRAWGLVWLVAALVSLALTVTIIMNKCRGPAHHDSPVQAAATPARDPGRAIWWKHPDGRLGAPTRIYVEGEDNPRWTLWDECELRVGGIVGATLTYSTTFSAESLPREPGDGAFLDVPDMWWTKTPPCGSETWCRCRWTSTDGEEEIGFAYRGDWTLGPRDERGFYLVHVQKTCEMFLPFIGQGGMSP